MHESVRKYEGVQLDLGNDRLISIGTLANSVSQHTGQKCTPQMIDNYEKHGLIQHVSRTKGGFRLFHVKDIGKVISIRHWLSKGFHLAQIKSRLEGSSEDSYISEQKYDLPEDRRSLILKTAARVFPIKGYEATTLQDIAEETGISTALIYQYFSNKEDLFLAFLDNISFANILKQIDASLQNKENPSIDFVRKSLITIANLYLSELSFHSALLRMLICSGPKYPIIIKAQMNKFVAPSELHLEQFFLNQVEAGIFRPVNPKLAVRIFIGIWTSIIWLREFFVGDEVMEVPAEEAVEDLVDLFLRCVVKEHPAK